MCRNEALETSDVRAGRRRRACLRVVPRCCCGISCWGRLCAPGLVLLLWQLAPVYAARDVDPRALQYQRALQLPPKATGQACAVLDADTLTHAASRSLNDLRVYAARAGHAEREVPFALTESASRPGETQTAAVLHAAMHEDEIVFDLAMPGRAYSEVDLELDAKNFRGAARVWGSDGQRLLESLGTYSVFDLSGQGLARSTNLSLAESSFPVLHVELRLNGLDGQRLKDLSPSIVKRADVPPSRSAQTVYTTVATMPPMETQGPWSLTTLTVPEHLPVERVRFVLDPKYARDFLRPVTVAATPVGRGYDAVGVAESVPGKIFRVERGALPDGEPAIDAQHLALNAPLGSNLRSPAKVMASVHNGSEAPLPIEAVELQMRQREVCFQAAPDASYELRYGDASLAAPVYAYAHSFVAESSPVVAMLGPEERNPRFDPHANAARKGDTRSETPWIVLMALIVVSGVIGLQSMRRREERGQ